MMNDDKILILEQGHIIEQGSNEALLEKKVCIMRCGVSRLIR
jgi:ABC-type multidrug transport system fused ATPase/permease subunit